METTARKPVPVDIPGCRFVAHRGLSGLETENTCAAFLSAAQRGYWGIETDVHATSDGNFVLCHDANLSRVSGVDFDVRAGTLAEARAIPLFDLASPERGTRSDLRVPELCDYLSICAKYGKHPVVELKDPFDRAAVERIVGEIRDHGILENAVFISFDWGNCLHARALCPDNEVLDLDGVSERAPLEAHVENRIGADWHFSRIPDDQASALIASGLQVFAWTVDDPAEAAGLAARGVTGLTTNLLEPALA